MTWREEGSRAGRKAEKSGADLKLAENCFVTVAVSESPAGFAQLYNSKPSGRNVAARLRTLSLGLLINWILDVEYVVRTTRVI